MKLKILALFILLLILFGCTEMTRGEKNLCFSLASKSYPNIPTCFSEKDCFEKTEGLFPSENLEYSQQRNIYTLRNHIGRSWYYFNLAKNENEKLSLSCKKGNISELPGSINQSRFYFASSLVEMDKALKTSFEIVSKEENSLAQDEVNLVKEESLYLSFVELKQILSDVETGSSNSKSYVSFYREKLDSFKQISRNKEFYGLVENKPFWLRIYEYIGGQAIVSVEKQKEVSMPFLREIFEKSVNSIESQLYLYDSFEALKKYPVHELMKLYAYTGGKKESVVSRFSDVIKDVDYGHKEIEKTRDLVWEEVEILVSELEITFSEDYYELNFPELENQTDSFGETRAMHKEFVSLKKEFIMLKELKTVNEISVGRELSSLKDLKNSLISLNNKYMNETEGLRERMEEYCDNRSKENISFEQNNKNSALNKQWEKVAFFSQKTISGTGEEKLIYCEKMLNEKKQYFLARDDYEKYLAEKAELTKDCFVELESLLKIYPSSEINYYFEELKNEEPTENNIMFFEDACKNLLSQIKTNIEWDDSVSEIKFDFQKLVEMYKNFEILCSLIGKEYDECNQFKNPEETYSSYIVSGKIDYEQVLPIKKDFLETLKSDLDSKKLLMEALLARFVEKNYALEVISPSNPKTNELIEASVLFYIENPLESFNQPFSANCGFNGNRVLHKDSAIENVFPESGRIVFNSLPKGNTGFSYSKELTIKTSEKTELLRASNEKSVFQRKIFLEEEYLFEKLVFSTVPPGNTSKVVVLVNNEEVLAYGKEKIEFDAKIKSKENSITAFFYVNGLISLKKSLSEEIFTGISSRKIIYSIKVKNNYSEPTDAILSVHLGQTSLIENVILTDEEGDQISVTILSDKIVFEEKDFLPGEEKEYSLTLRVSDKEYYYKKRLSDILSENKHILNESLVKKIERLLDSEFDFSTYKEAENIFEEVENQLKTYSDEEERHESIYIARKSAEKKIGELERLIFELEDMNRFSESKELASLIYQARQLVNTDDLSKIAQGQEMLSSFSFENLEESSPEKNLDDHQKRIDLSEMIFEAEEKLVFLEKELSADKSDLIAARFVPPITDSRLKSIRLDLLSLKGIIDDPKEAEDKLKKIILELDNAINSLKLQAITRFNEGVENNVSEELLSKGKELIDSNNFVGALLALSASDKNENGFSYPFLGFIPILVIIGVALILKFKVSTHKKNSENKKSEVIDTWED